MIVYAICPVYRPVGLSKICFDWIVRTSWRLLEVRFGGYFQIIVHDITASKTIYFVLRTFHMYVRLRREQLPNSKDFYSSSRSFANVCLPSPRFVSFRIESSAFMHSMHSPIGLETLSHHTPSWPCPLPVPSDWSTSSGSVVAVL